MNAHVYAVLSAHWHHGLEEIHEVGPQRVTVDSVVQREQLSEMLHGGGIVLGDVPVHEALGLDYQRVYEGVPVFGSHDRVEGLYPCEHFRGIVVLRSRAPEYAYVEIGEARIVEIQRRGAVLHRMRKVGTRPVEHGHEVVADCPDSALAEVAQALYIGLYQGIPLGTGILYRLAHGQALDHRPPHAVLRDHIPDMRDILLLPEFPVGNVMESRDNAFDAYLAQHLQGNLVFGAEPAPSLFHKSDVYSFNSKQNKVNIFSYLCQRSSSF